MIIRYQGYEEVRIALEKLITPETVFVCVGSSKAVFDTFGPLMGDLLKRRGVPYYGDNKYNVNSVTMYDRLEEIYDIDGNENHNIIAIDAAVTDRVSDKNKVIFKEGQGVKPGAGIGRKFPMIGDNSLLLFTLHRSELDETMKYYNKSLPLGRRKDLCDRNYIRLCAIKIADMIAEIYHEVCKEKNQCLN
jgi:putative sporulation protein YyaC